MLNYIVVRHAGKLWKIKLWPHETQEQAHDRAWYIALNNATIEDSHIWANKKYFGIEY